MSGGPMVRRAIWSLAPLVLVWLLPQTCLGAPSPPLNAFGMVRKIYPMPARGPVKVEVFGPLSGAASIRIVQPTGRVVRWFRFEGLPPSMYRVVDIDVSGLPTGVYFLWYSDVSEQDIKAGRRLVIKR